MPNLYWSLFIGRSNKTNWTRCWTHFTIRRVTVRFSNNEWLSSRVSDLKIYYVFRARIGNILRKTICEAAASLIGYVEPWAIGAWNALLKIDVFVSAENLNTFDHCCCVRFLPQVFNCRTKIRPIPLTVYFFTIAFYKCHSMHAELTNQHIWFVESIVDDVIWAR